MEWGGALLQVGLYIECVSKRFLSCDTREEGRVAKRISTQGPSFYGVLPCIHVHFYAKFAMAAQSGCRQCCFGSNFG